MVCGLYTYVCMYACGERHLMGLRMFVHTFNGALYVYGGECATEVKCFTGTY